MQGNRMFRGQQHTPTHGSCLEHSSEFGLVCFQSPKIRKRRSTDPSLAPQLAQITRQQQETIQIRNCPIRFLDHMHPVSRAVSCASSATTRRRPHLRPARTRSRENTTEPMYTDPGFRPVHHYHDQTREARIDTHGRYQDRRCEFHARKAQKKTVGRAFATFGESKLRWKGLKKYSIDNRKGRSTTSRYHQSALRPRDPSPKHHCNMDPRARLRRLLRRTQLPRNRSS